MPIPDDLVHLIQAWLTDDIWVYTWGDKYHIHVWLVLGDRVIHMYPIGTQMKVYSLSRKKIICWVYFDLNRIRYNPHRQLTLCDMVFSEGYTVFQPTYEEAYFTCRTNHRDLQGVLDRLTHPWGTPFHPNTLRWVADALQLQPVVPDDTVKNSL